MGEIPKDTGYSMSALPLASDSASDRINQMDSWRDRIVQGDCLAILPQLPAESVDLIVTSPPYADKRKNTYGGVHPDQYVEWFLPIGAELKRVLKPDGTFILNIKEKVLEGERHTY